MAASLWKATIWVLQLLRHKEVRCVFPWFHPRCCWWVEQFGGFPWIPMDPMGPQGAETLEHVVSIIRVELAGSSSCKKASTRATRWKSRCVIKQKNRTRVNSFDIFGESMMHLFFGYGFPVYWVAKVFLYVCIKYCITASCDCKTHVPWSCFTIRQRLIQLSEVLTCVKEEATIQILV